MRLAGELRLFLRDAHHSCSWTETHRSNVKCELLSQVTGSSQRCAQLLFLCLQGHSPPPTILRRPAPEHHVAGPYNFFNELDDMLTRLGSA